MVVCCFGFWLNLWTSRFRLGEIGVDGFATRVTLHVIPQTPLVGEGFLTNVALVGTHAHVNEHVGMQAVVIGKGLLANFTLRTFTVGAQMRYHRVVVEKPLFANSTLNFVELLLLGGFDYSKLFFLLGWNIRKVGWHNQTAFHSGVIFFT